MLFHSELLTAYFLHPLHFRLKHKSDVSLGMTKTSIYIITELNPGISPKLNMNLARNYPLALAPLYLLSSITTATHAREDI